DEVDLLRPDYVDRSSSYRYYRESQIERLNRILVLKDLGFSIRHIHRLLAQNPSRMQIADLVRRRQAELEQSIVHERARLARAAARLDLVDRAGVCEALDVAVRQTPPRLVASVRDTLSSHDDADDLFEELESHTGRRVRRPQRGAIWHACAPGLIDCEAFVFLPCPVPGSRRVRVHELSEARVASLVYHGDGNFIPPYRAMRPGLTRSGIEPAGPKREIYLDDGGRDTASVTEIQFPIELETRRASE